MLELYAFGSSDTCGLLVHWKRHRKSRGDDWGNDNRDDEILFGLENDDGVFWQRRKSWLRTYWKMYRRDGKYREDRMNS